MPGSNPVPVAVPAATLVLLRDGALGLETLLLQRNPDLAFAGGMWVWPGGRVEPADWAAADAASGGSDRAGEPDPTPTTLAGLARLEAAARVAAVREAQEEASLTIATDDLRWFSHWTPPPVSVRRYATFFFAAATPPDGGEVQVDGSEIHRARWWAPAAALAARDVGELTLSPPTWITLHRLAALTSTAEALAELGAGPPTWFATHLAAGDEGAIALYAGDAGYDDGDASRPGPRHRLVMAAAGWRYEHDLEGS